MHAVHERPLAEQNTPGVTMTAATTFLACTLSHPLYHTHVYLNMQRRSAMIATQVRLQSVGVSITIHAI